MQATLNVGGNKLNAQTIEHLILRKRASSNIQEVHIVVPLKYYNCRHKIGAVNNTVSHGYRCTKRASGRRKNQ